VPRDDYATPPAPPPLPSGGSQRKRSGYIPDLESTARNTLLASLTLNSYNYVPDPDRPGKVKRLKNTPAEGFGHVPDKLLVRNRRSDRNRNKIRTRDNRPALPHKLQVTMRGAPLPVCNSGPFGGEWTMPDSILYGCKVCKSFLPGNPHLHMPCTEHRLALKVPIDSVPLAPEECIPIPEPGTERFKKFEWTEVEVVNGTVEARVEHRRPKSKSHPGDVQLRQQQQQKQQQPRQQQQQQAPAPSAATLPPRKRSKFLKQLVAQCKADGRSL
jgi:hypothetical protein